MTEARQQRLLERLQEDEGVRGDLSGEAANALMTWASTRVQASASDPARSDETVEAEVKAIRYAARTAAYSGETDPQRVVAAADAALG